MKMASSYSMDLNKLRETAESLYRSYSSCNLCPRQCGVNRIKGETGSCGLGSIPRIASHNLHFGEEPPLVGTGGSGTIFLSGCTMHCLFCQNYPISQHRNGTDMTEKELAECMLKLQERGAENINFVTPTHFLPSILKALLLAKQNGLNIPIVYNTSGYERAEIIESVLDLIDIWLPDIKYSDPKLPSRYSDAPDFIENNYKSVRIMATKKELEIRNGKALKGMIIRHLVLPGNVNNTLGVLSFIAEKIGRDAHISLMSQYFPAYRAGEYHELSRRVTREEYEKTVIHAEKLGMENVLIQDV